MAKLCDFLYMFEYIRHAPIKPSPYGPFNPVDVIYRSQAPANAASHAMLRTMLIFDSNS